MVSWKPSFRCWFWLLALPALLGPPSAAHAQTCNRTLQAEVSALDQPFFWNRLGAVQPHGMVYALTRDVVALSSGTSPGPGNAVLRRDKRPRPLVLRMSVGDCLEITFHNWLAPSPVDEEQAHTREASIHVVGMQLRNSIADDGSWVGRNASSLVPVGGTAVYTLYAEREGAFLLHSTGALVGGEGDNGTISAGLFGVVNVEPANSVWYRSQLTRQEMDWATQVDGSGNPRYTANGHPVLNYDAVYPTGPFAGKPILKILDGNQIFHSDLTAIIAGTGPNAEIVPNPYPPVAVSPDRNKPFREFTIVFHDEIAAVQAFPQFNDAVLGHTLHSVRDAFAINYGTGGIGAEILANRLNVGPMHQCTECLYEEFFLSSWTVGDPAMVVDVPANAPCSVSQLRQENHTSSPCTPTPGPKATKAFYPDDPSNVYHSYLNDHVKFRNVHAGSEDHHIFHLHAHQWLHTPDGGRSTNLDSQAIGPGAGFTYEILHGGSGNRAKTPGDAIFHCHFYPHFAMGMWGLWRVHDVFEEGTRIDENGRPEAFVFQIQTSPGVYRDSVLVSSSRALPDGEIPHGTPIPGVVPLPGQPMPPMPQTQAGVHDGQPWLANTNGNPGFPFFIPAVAGHRPPHPPLDFYKDPVTGVVHDGGLPRHVITAGTFTERHDRLSFEKHLLTARGRQLKEAGEPIELRAMTYHSKVNHPTCLPDGTCDPLLDPSSGQTVRFPTNGAPAIGGAPYADPCLASPQSTTTPPPLRFLTFKSANIQMDVSFNKEGWHFPQQRMTALWEDVDDFLNRTRPPEPLFMRANTRDCVTYLHTNLVPAEYELDDFQVRTPTDILGQHIHLVKFDVTASDGAANGFNYEDGTFSPEEVRTRIAAMTAPGGNWSGSVPLQVKPHPFFSSFNNPDWLGAQTTIQRWYVDDVLDNNGDDRTHRTVFTHDHFGPSTHQQTGLYAGVAIEPTGSQWYHNETGVQLGTRHDGGPVSWQAVIEGVEPDEIYREFLFEFGDFQHAYKVGSPATPHPELGFADPARAINPPGRVEEWDRLLVDKPWVFEKPFFEGECPGGVPPPCPEAIAANDPGTIIVNYRNEPVALRIFDPSTNFQAAGIAGDLSHVFRSNVTRVIPSLNTQPGFYPPLTADVAPGDPYTPLLRAYENDRVQIRFLVGSHEEDHHVSVHGVRWLFEPSEPNSGFRNTQMMGISEHYEFEIPNLPKKQIATQGSVDHLWKVGGSVDDLWNGTWGLLRAYRGQRQDLVPLSNNPAGLAPIDPPGAYNGICPQNAPVKSFEVAAVAAQQALTGGTLVYNSRPGGGLQACYATSSNSVSCTSSGLQGPLHDPTALLFVRKSDLISSNGVWVLNSNVKTEPLILRANAGDCIEVKLYNYLPETPYDLPGYNLMPNIIDRFNVNQVVPSTAVGLHPQLVSYDITRSDGVNAGFNPVQTVQPGHFQTYQWYAGQIVFDPVANSLNPVDTEFGATNLVSSDPIKGTNKGLVGALIIEPKGATWVENPDAQSPQTRATADVYAANAPTERAFREFVNILQSDINLRYSNNQPVRLTAVKEDAEESGQDAANYRTEPVWFRKNYLPQTEPQATRQFQFANVFSNTAVGGVDPETPVYIAPAGEQVRFRLLVPGGHAQSHVFGLHGHIWDEEPYQSNSTILAHNPISEWKGALWGHGPGNHFDALLRRGAGSAFHVTGDYMWRDYMSWRLSDGIWGILRVIP
jgi:hypothetical protein